MLNEGYQPNKGKLDKSNPPKGGSGLRCINCFSCEAKKICLWGMPVKTGKAIIFYKLN